MLKLNGHGVVPQAMIILPLECQNQSYPNNIFGVVAMSTLTWEATVVAKTDFLLALNRTGF